MPKLDCGGVLSLIYFSTGNVVKNLPAAAATLIQSFAKVAEERNRELLSICYVCTDMNRKLSMLNGAILIIHSLSQLIQSHIFIIYQHLLVAKLLKDAATPTSLA